MQALRIQIYGIVQGVGFRPFVARLATRLGIAGDVANKGSFVEIHAQAPKEALDAFCDALPKEAPPRSTILRILRHEIPLFATDSAFRIIESEAERGDIFVSPDIATCDLCAKELYDPNNRRYLHPFINCTACGPRLTILEQMPYDRVRTTMKTFPMCPECEREYHSPETRRYDAQPVCCNDCGPRLALFNPKQPGTISTDNPILTARHELMRGKIIAVKGIGGFHLACNALDGNAVQRLRTLKHRPAKPFAVMFRNLDSLKKYCHTTPEADKWLTGHQKPIVLLPKRDGSPLADAVAPNNPNVGAFLPYTPLHLLLFDYPPDTVPMTDALVLTSGNQSGAPICRSDENVREQLAEFCDLVLTHDRPILLRADDSVMDLLDDVPYMIRRSRGFAPLPFPVDVPVRNTVLGIGGELKNCFCIGKDGLFYPSPYIGDMEDLRSVEALRESVRRMCDLLEATPTVVACDLHPKYNSTLVAQEMNLPVLPVQHHYAHVLSCMAENNYLQPVIGISFDGTGYGTDKSIWGGEILLCDTKGFQRFAHIPTFPQPGGDASARDGWRIATALLLKLHPQQTEKLTADLELCTPQEQKIVATMVRNNINTVPSTSAGRLFDAVSALLGICRHSTFEGEAAMALQFAAKETQPPEETNLVEFLRSLPQRRIAGESTAALAWQFHWILADFALQQAIAAREHSHCDTVALTGGVFQNTLLVRMTKQRMEQNGFRVLLHSLVPPNDGGIALGQALFATVNVQNLFST